VTSNHLGSQRRGTWTAPVHSPCRGIQHHHQPVRLDPPHRQRRGLWMAMSIDLPSRGSVPHRGTRQRRVGVARVHPRQGTWQRWVGSARDHGRPGTWQRWVGSARDHRRPRTWQRWVGAVVLVGGCWMLAGCQGPVVRSGVEEASPSRAVVGGGAGVPVSIIIPAVGVDARVVPVGLRADRTMEVPAVDLAGWYQPGPRPGEAGPAVIVGHVDSRHGPAVFFRLGELRPGDRVMVGQQGGRPRSFLVERVERRPKADLPVERIWNRTHKAVLRLITCGGSFDRSTGHYRDNVIVYATAGS
jgi:Sortase domain